MVSVKKRETNIQQYQLRIKCRKFCQDILKILNASGLIPPSGQSLFQCLGDGLIVLRNQDSVHSSASFLKFSPVRRCTVQSFIGMAPIDS